MVSASDPTDTGWSASSSNNPIQITCWYAGTVASDVWRGESFGIGPASTRSSRTNSENEWGELPAAKIRRRTAACHLPAHILPTMYHQADPVRRFQATLPNYGNSPGYTYERLETTKRSRSFNSSGTNRTPTSPVESRYWSNKKPKRKTSASWRNTTMSWWTRWFGRRKPWSGNCGRAEERHAVSHRSISNGSSIREHTSDAEPQRYATLEQCWRKW